MPDRTSCAHCGTVGYVRREHVIEGGRAMIQFYCGRCERTWTVAEGSNARRAAQRRRRVSSASDKP